MLRILLLISVLMLSGCSLFGDRYRNRSLDYLNVEQQAPTLGVDGTPIPSIDRYAIPALAKSGTLPAKFEVPAPLPLTVSSDNEATSLNDYRSEGLNPRLEHDGSGALVLHVDGGFAQAWTAITDAIAASSLKLADLNRSTGTWYLEIETKVAAEDRGWWAKLWGKETLETKSYLLKLSRTRLGGYLSLLVDVDALASEELNSLVLNEIKQQLDK